jgi:hypothetical protein
VPGFVERYQRRTARLTGQVAVVVSELAGRAACRVLEAMGVRVSRHTALRVLGGLPQGPLVVPRVLGVDDFALRRRHTYATVFINAETGQRVDVVVGRDAAVVRDWLNAHPGVEIVCRDGSATYAQGIREALPHAVQVADRWHLWRGLCEAVKKETAAHAACWGATQAAGMRTGKLAETTGQRWTQVHDLLDAGVGLLDISRRLGIALNTVKRYVRAESPERIQSVPRYRDTLVDPYRDHLRQRRTDEPAVSVGRLLVEIRGLGYAGSMNLLARYLNQGRHLDQHRHLSPRKASALLLSDPDHLHAPATSRRQEIAAACYEMSTLRELIGHFAALLRPDPGNENRLTQWVEDVNLADLPHLHSFVRGIELDHDAVIAAITHPFHNGRTEGVNTKTKLIKRQMYGRANFALLRHRILLGNPGDPRK